MGLEGEALDEMGVAALPEHAEARTVHLSASEHRYLRSLGVEAGDRAVAQAKIIAVGVSQGDPDVAVAEVGKMIQREPVIARVVRGIMATLRQQPRANHRPHFLMPHVGIGEVQAKRPHLHAAEVLRDLVAKGEAGRTAQQRDAGLMGQRRGGGGQQCHRHRPRLFDGYRARPHAKVVEGLAANVPGELAVASSLIHPTGDGAIACHGDALEFAFHEVAARDRRGGSEVEARAGNDGEALVAHGRHVPGQHPQMPRQEYFAPQPAHKAPSP